MIEFQGPRDPIRPLFEGHQHLPAIRESVLEGRIGRLWVDREEGPRVARMDAGCYAIFGGDASNESAAEAIAGTSESMELAFPDEPWRLRMMEVWGERLRPWVMASFVCDQMSRDRLRAFVERLADGYGLRPLEPDELAELGRDFEPHGLQTYVDPEALHRHGMAWGAMYGDRLACAATSYAQSKDQVEVAIATHPEHRGRGLATATAARFCLAAFERGLDPLWNASNPVSQRLALRLGYRRIEDCVTLKLEPA